MRGTSLPRYVRMIPLRFVFTDAATGNSTRVISKTMQREWTKFLRALTMRHLLARNEPWSNKVSADDWQSYTSINYSMALPKVDYVKYTDVFAWLHLPWQTCGAPHCTSAHVFPDDFTSLGLYWCSHRQLNKRDSKAMQSEWTKFVILDYVIFVGKEWAVKQKKKVSVDNWLSCAINPYCPKYVAYNFWSKSNFLKFEQVYTKMYEHLEQHYQHTWSNFTKFNFD